jgi:hypothetical protein
LEDPRPRRGERVSLRIIPNEHGYPPGTRADGEVIGEAETGPRRGLKVSGFGIRQRREGT